MRDPKKICAGFLSTYLLYLMIYHSAFYHFLNEWYVDKVFHIMGGYLIVALAMSAFKLKNTMILFLAVFMLGSAWEFLEIYLLNPQLSPALLKMSSVIFSWGDIFADMAGGLVYYLLDSDKEESKSIEQVRSTT